MIERALYIENLLSPGRTLLLLGPRRSGKTTLLQHFLNGTTKSYLLLNGDNVRDQSLLSTPDESSLNPTVSGIELLVIDEAQNIENIGRSLKIINDSHPEIAVIATGSSSFDLRGQIGEPLVGRKHTVLLYPFWIDELCANDQTAPPALTWQRLRDTLLIFGQYPQSFTAPNNRERTDFLIELVDSLLLKDILAYQEVKGSRVLRRLLELLAHQIGGEVSLSELGSHLNIHKATVDRYLDLLEKSFVIFRLGGFSRNMRSEVTRTAKYYFYDVGVRNAIINNFNPLELRDDVGKLWENYALVERMKARAYTGPIANQYFWRTWQQSEIDLIEDRGGRLYGYEFKWNPNKTVKIPREWTNAYPENTSFEVITPENFLQFAQGGQEAYKTPERNTQSEKAGSTDGA
jgi:predicted AAA+ superfamily ATPase